MIPAQSRVTETAFQAPRAGLENPMSIPAAPNPAKLVIGCFLKEKALIHQVAAALVSVFGAPDIVSRWYPFSYTTYYEKEMGAPLYRRMLCFKPLIPQDRLPEIKRFTNDLEKEFTIDGKRRVNIDPGYVVHERFVLATGKNFTHRIYLSEGIFADLTLIYTQGKFQRLPWTYPDYGDLPMIQFLKVVREKYISDLKQQFQNP